MEVYDRALEGGFNSDLLYSRAMLAEKIGGWTSWSAISSSSWSANPIIPKP